MKRTDFLLTDMLMKMYDNSAEAIFFFDRFETVIAMNRAAEQILEPEIVQRMIAGEERAICFSCKGYTSNQELKTCVSCYIENPTSDFSSFQVYLDTKGKGVIPYAASYQTIDEENKIRLFMLRDLTRQFETQEALHQNVMTKRVIQAQEDERKRISRELHDSVAQEMISALVDLRVLKYMNIDDEVLQRIQQTEVSLMRLLDDIRHLSVELRPATLDDLGLEAAFRTHFKWIEKNYGLVIDFTTNLKAKRYGEEIETVVYRVCQEAVLNALKYAGTDEIKVTIFEHEGKLELHVEDTGVGFDQTAGDPQGTGLGLYGMRERVELVDGQFILQSELGKGTKVTIRLPLASIS